MSISIYRDSEMALDDSVTDSIVACRDGLCLWGSSWSASVTLESDEWSEGGCMLGSHLEYVIISKNDMDLYISLLKQ